MSRQYSQSIIDNTWQFLVLRSQHWQQLRPEKSWRPIICLELDGRPCHELTLGVDGQNPNLREPAMLHDAGHKSNLTIRVYYQGSGKSTGKSRKKRKEVASCVLSLGEACEKQGNERHLQLRLSGIPALRKKSDAQKPQPCSSLFVRIRPPVAYLSSVSCSETMVDESVITRPSSPLSEVFSECSNVPEEQEPHPPGLRRRKVAKGFAIYSDEDPSEYCISDEYSPVEDKKMTWMASDTEDALDVVSLPLHPSPPSPVAVIFPNLLPLQRVGTTVSTASTSSFSMLSAAYDTFTYYRELREAQLDSELEVVITRLVHEWKYLAVTLLSIAALTTTVFGFSPGTIFGVDGIAVRSLTISAVSSALGLAIDAFLLFSYLGADVRKFQTLAVGVYSDYFFFALTSRLPLLATVVALTSLSVFLISVAFTAWPGAVLWMCGFAGVLVSLQYLVKGTELCIRGIRTVFRAAFSCFARRPSSSLEPVVSSRLPSAPECSLGVDVKETTTGVHITVCAN